jgi:hypothetical protein
MSFWHFKRLYRSTLALLVALLVVGLISPVALAEDETPTLDMGFALEYTRDSTDPNLYIFSVGCQNNTTVSISKVFATLPLDSRLEYQYYSTSSTTTYVRRGVPERLEIDFGTVSPGACPGIQIYFKRIPNSRGKWTTYATGHWDGEPTNDGVRTNPITVNLNAGSAGGAVEPGRLSGGGTVRPGDTVTFSGDGYYKNETVSLWLNLADGRVAALGGTSTIQADDQGHIAFTLLLSNDIPLGPTTVVAYGQTSKITKLGFMDIVSADSEPTPSS